MALFGGAIGDFGDTQLTESVRPEGQWQGLVCVAIKLDVGRRQHVRILERIASYTRLNLVYHKCSAVEVAPLFD